MQFNVMPKTKTGTRRAEEKHISLLQVKRQKRKLRESAPNPVAWLINQTLSHTSFWEESLEFRGEILFLGGGLKPIDVMLGAV